MGTRIQRERERVGLSRAELGAQVRLPEAELEAVEQGRSRPDAEMLLDIADALGVPLSDLMKPAVE